jgi:ubiquinone/menaquinone biosynthesis C-methylase UbiE
MVDENSVSKLRSTWESAAPGWAKWERKFSAGLTEVTNTLMDMAGIGPGHRVLDLACGAGSQSIQAAKRVGPSGRIVASDISATMLEHVRQNAKMAGLENIETIESAAEGLQISQLPFDASICRLGLMLFPAPGSALEAIQRILKPGARFAALVFSTPDNNPVMAQPTRILLRHANKQPPGPGEPGIFALGSAGVLENLLSGRGFVDIKMTSVQAPFHLASADDALTFLQQAAGAYRAVIADLSDDAKADAWAEVRDCLGQFEDATGFNTEHQFIIGSGAKPS